MDMQTSGPHQDQSSAGFLADAGPRTPFFIDDVDRVLFVQTGTLDLFLVESRDGEAVGARTHVLRLGKGQALFGMQHPDSVSQKLLAMPSPGGQVLELSRTQDLSDIPRAAQLLEDWISALSRAIAQNRKAKSFEFLQPDTTPVFNHPQSVLPSQGVVWVRRLEGTSSFLGDWSLAESEGFFPVSVNAWLDVSKGSKLMIIGTVEFLALDPLWTGLQRFHATALHCLIESLKASEDRERARLQRRKQTEQTRLDLAIRVLASPLEGPEEAPHAAEETDPWFLACAALGKPLGIDFKPAPDRRRGVQMDPVGAIARASGVRMRIVALKGKWWKRDNGPLLAVSERDHTPIALLPVTPGKYDAFDAPSGTRTRVSQKFAASLQPLGYSFYRPFPLKKLNALDLIRFSFHGCRGELTTLLITAMATGLLALVAPVMTGIVFDSVIPGADRSLLLEIVLVLLVVSASIALFQVVQNFAMLRLEAKMDSSTQSAVWDRLLSLHVPFFRNYAAGDLAMRGLTVSSIRQVLTGSLLSTLFSGVFSVFTFAVLFYYSPSLALLATGLALVIFLGAFVIGFQNLQHQREATRISGHLSGVLLQIIQGIAKLRVSGAEARAFAAWAKEFAQEKTAALRARKTSAMLVVFISAFPVLSSVVIFYAAGRLLDSPAGSGFSTGGFLAFNAAFMQFQGSALSLCSALISALAVIPLYERCRPILEALPEVDRTKSYPGELSGRVEVKHVNFRYRADAAPVLRDVSINVAPEQFIAIVGPSGSGKSTLLRMLLGFETPESGSIYFDNQDLAHLDVQAVRRQIGVVLQTGRLLTGSIYQNIVGSSALTTEDAWQAAVAAGLERDLKAMPMGMHTVIAEGGGGLSGGQRQRLMIARAIVRKPRIILFDEATSALDIETQAIVIRSLARLQATRIVIAHRLSTVASADYIYVIERGAVVQEGTYRELLNKPGAFFDLAHRQIA